MACKIRLCMRTNLQTFARKPTSGTVHFNGVDITERPDTSGPCSGYLPQDYGVYPRMSAIQIARITIAILKGITNKALAKISSEIGAGKWSNLWTTHGLVATYSGRYRQAVSVIAKLFLCDRN